ncbi:MAG: Cys-Xaa-Xaa-Xaa repeat radical SAM target protein [Bacteroidaceae bacterium]|nr:Cys-Xaa-Xaa-Xaa repeat radical SAM target protein [Bacteroidaceae bacterium]
MKKNEELQSRREFFKKAAKGALPILGATLLANIPMISQATEDPMGCNFMCSGGCQGGCGRSCSYGCSGSCSGNCSGGCKGGCSRSCSVSCSGSSRGYGW